MTKSNDKITSVTSSQILLWRATALGKIKTVVEFWIFKTENGQGHWPTSLLIPVFGFLPKTGMPTFRRSYVCATPQSFQLTGNKQIKAFRK